MATELFEYAVACGEDDAMFSLGLCLAQQGQPAEAYLWGLLSIRHRPEGQGQRLVDHVGAELTEAQRQAAAEQAESWTRPNKTMVFHCTSGTA